MSSTLGSSTSLSHPVIRSLQSSTHTYTRIEPETAVIPFCLASRRPLVSLTRLSVKQSIRQPIRRPFAQPTSQPNPVNPETFDTACMMNLCT